MSSAGTRESNQPVTRTLIFTEPHITDIQEEKEQRQDQDQIMADDNSTTSGTSPIGKAANATILEAADMFKKANPKSKTKISGLAASIKSEDRQLSAKDKQKIKYNYTKPIDHLFDVPLHYVSNLSGKSEGTGPIEGTNIQNAFIATSLKILAFKDWCTEYDVINVRLIPKLINAGATTPVDPWDFKERVHFLDHRGKIDWDTCNLWVSDCILWDGSGYEAEDMDWLLTFAKNSCSTSLRQKVDKKFQKLDNDHRGGVTYLKMMYEVMIFVNDSVIVSLQ